jgi:protein-S-isoprenylcysteine O-methyltransferase Ste14
MPTLRLVASSLASTAVYGLLLFLPAWTLRWPRAWELLTAVFAGMVVSGFWAFGKSQGLLEERRAPPFQPGQPAADKLLVVAFLLVFPAYLIFIALDVFRFHLLPVPAPLVSALGFVLVFAGWLVISLAFRANAFAATIVKHQSERGQTVVDGGPYGVVRHPIYAGVIPLIVGAALWLQSYAAALSAIVPIALLVLRILVEEDFLRRRLPGYDAYAQRVRHRLIPRIW